MALKISGYSTALFSTFYFIEDWNLLFDAGDGLSACLLQKSRKIKHAFISHPDRDHLCGLLQFNQLNARPDFPIIYYPKDSGSFPALANFTKTFDPHVGQAKWLGIDNSKAIPISPQLQVLPIVNGHIETDENTFKSFSFLVQQTKRKLKEEFAHLPGKEIGLLRKEKGEDAITNLITKNVFGYSGDTPVGDFSHWQNTETLIHECTFLRKEDMESKTHKKHNKHSVLSDVMDMAAQLQLKQLILGHFSSRYKKEEITQVIAEACEQHQIPFPVYCIFPGVFEKDVLKSTPVWKGLLT